MKRLSDSSSPSKKLCLPKPAEQVLQLLLEQRPASTLPLLCNKALLAHCKELGLPVRTSFSFVQPYNVEQSLDLGLDKWDIVPLALTHSPEFFKLALRLYPICDETQLMSRAAEINAEAIPRASKLDFEWNSARLSLAGTLSLLKAHRFDLIGFEVPIVKAIPLVPMTRPLCVALNKAMRKSFRVRESFGCAVVEHGRIDWLQWLSERAEFFTRGAWAAALNRGCSKERDGLVRWIIEHWPAQHPMQLNWLIRESDRVDYVQWAVERGHPVLEAHLALAIRHGALQCAVYLRQQLGPAALGQLEFQSIGSLECADWCLANGWPRSPMPLLLCAMSAGNVSLANALVDEMREPLQLLNQFWLLAAVHDLVKSAAAPELITLLLEKQLELGFFESTKSSGRLLASAGVLGSVRLMKRLEAAGYRWPSRIWSKAWRSLPCLEYALACRAPWPVGLRSLASLALRETLLHCPEDGVWDFFLERSPLSLDWFCQLFSTESKLPVARKHWLVERLACLHQSEFLNGVHQLESACWAREPWAGELMETYLRLGGRLTRSWLVYAVEHNRQEEQDLYTQRVYGFALKVERMNGLEFTLDTKQTQLKWQWPASAQWNNALHLIDATNQYGLLDAPDFQSDLQLGHTELTAGWELKASGLLLCSNQHVARLLISSVFRLGCKQLRRCIKQVFPEVLKEFLD